MMLGIVETDEYELLSNKREHKGIIEVLQDFFYESPFKAFDFRFVTIMIVNHGLIYQEDFA